MISKLFCLLVLLSLQMQGREASVVPVVETTREITFTSGEEVLLKCAYERKPHSVFWGFRSDSSSSDLLLVKHQFYPVGKRSGPGYDEGRFNITDDYSLVIHDVSVEDEGRYICNVADLKTGQVLRNYTNVAVTVQAIRPLVRIHQCGSNSSVSVNVTDNPKASCLIHITSNQRYVKLDCFVEGAKPQVDMSWVNNNTRQDVINGASLTTTMGKREGTVDQILTVLLEVSEFQSDQEYYFTCTAEGPAVGGIASVTVGITNVPPEVSTSAIAPATIRTSVVLVVLVVLMLVVLISVLFWKKYKRRHNTNDDDPQTHGEASTPLQGVPDRRPLLDTKRTEIFNYLPDTPTTMSKDTNHINLGVFGLGKAGKSSLINSLIFSLTGRYPGKGDNRATTHGETDSNRKTEETIALTNHIHLLNYKGIVKYDPTKQMEILSKIKGQSIKIHCPIFICDSRNLKEPSKKFMKSLSKDVGRYFGRGIMLVIPKKGDLDDNDDRIKAAMSKTIRIPTDHVWIFENYTLESHEEDVERSLKFLDFILHCLKVVEENQQFRDIKYEDVRLQYHVKDEDLSFITVEDT